MKKTKASIHLTVPANCQLFGTTRRGGQKTRLRDVVIPLNFASAKGRALAAMLEVRGELEGVEASVWEGELHVSGKEGTPSLQRHQDGKSVEPAFLDLLAKGLANSEEEGEEDLDDEELVDEELEDEGLESDEEDGADESEE